MHDCGHVCLSVCTSYINYLSTHPSIHPFIHSHMIFAQAQIVQLPFGRICASYLFKGIMNCCWLVCTPSMHTAINLLINPPQKSSFSISCPHFLLFDIHPTKPSHLVLLTQILNQTAISSGFSSKCIACVH